MRDLVATMMTFDRAPMQDCLATTLANLHRSGAFGAECLKDFILVDSGSPDPVHRIASALPAGLTRFSVVLAEERRVPTHNAVVALRAAVERDARWVLFLEDDIDVCDDFIDGVRQWLEDHQGRSPVYTFGANYGAIRERARKGHRHWDFPLDQYYGTLAFALRTEDAADLADFWWQNVNVQTYDLLMASWGKERGHMHFVASAPSFVQHIGRDSTIRPGGQFHTYDSWPGHEWSYRKVHA